MSDKDITTAKTMAPAANALQFLSRYPVLKVHHTAARHKARKTRVMPTLKPTPTSETP